MAAYSGSIDDIVLRIRNGWLNVDDLGGSIPMPWEADLMLICLQVSLEEGALSIIHRLNRYRKTFSRHPDGFVSQPVTDFFPRFEYKPMHGKDGQDMASVYTLILPDPKSGSWIFLQLTMLHRSSGERQIVGFFTSNNFAEIKHMVGLSNYNKWKTKPFIGPEQLIISLLSYVSDEYYELVVRTREKHRRTESTLDSTPKPDESSETQAVNQLTLISEQLGRLRETLKRLLGDLRALRECGVKARQQLDERAGIRERPLNKALGDMNIEAPTEDEELLIQGMAQVERTQNQAYDMTQELYEDVRDSLQKVWERKQEKKDRMQETLIKLTDALKTDSDGMVKLTNALKRDSSNMKMIAILTAFFLPFTFMAILLTTPMFRWPDPDEGKVIIWLPFRVYWIASGLMTLILGCWVLWLFKSN